MVLLPKTKAEFIQSLTMVEDPKNVKNVWVFKKEQFQILVLENLH